MSEYKISPLVSENSYSGGVPYIKQDHRLYSEIKELKYLKMGDAYVINPKVNYGRMAA
jgi:hypothetical protein